MQTIDGQDFRILFSGDTIVQREYWANNPLSQLWGQLALALMDAYPDDQLYWFLISKGYKTYRFLPVFFREFFPRYDSTTPSSMKHLIEAVALARFGKRFCSETGVLRDLECDCHLRAEVADVTENRLKNRHVAFFDQANPGHANGDELCCIARLTRDNLNQKAYRVIGHPMDLQSLVEGSPSVGQ